MKKFLISLAIALILCVPAFATDYSGYFSTGYTCSDGSNWNNFTVSTSDDVYFARVNMESSSPSSTRIYAFSATYGSQYLVNGRKAGDAINRTYTLDSSPVDGVYYSDFSGTGSISSNCSFNPDYTPFPYGTTASAMVAAFSEFLASSGGGDSVSSSFTLPRGNVLYFQVESEQDVQLTSYMDTLSNIINFNTATYGAWGDTGQRYGEAAALPTAGTVFPLLSQSPIAWQKDSSTNILGQTKVGLATKHCIVGQWYCFYNPNANHIEGADPYNASPGASVVVQGSFSQIKVYPVNQKLSVVDGDLYSGSNDDFDSYFDGTIDGDGTVTWTNQDGNIEAPAAGGQNFEDGPKSATSLLEGIRVTLETVVHELQTLFTFGYSAIQSLVGIMSDFVSVFSGLYTWLPAEVYSALMSAVVVAIVIGVFKVFL